jgi:GTP cyclohydrolase I
MFRTCIVDKMTKNKKPKNQKKKKKKKKNCFIKKIQYCSFLHSHLTEIMSDMYIHYYISDNVFLFHNIHLIYGSRFVEQIE